MINKTVHSTDPRIIPDPEKPAEKSDLPSELAACLPPSDVDSRKMIAAYYAQIEFLDTQIGRIVDHLKKIGEYENTIIIFHK